MGVQLHNIPPVWNEKSKILILGSFPSVKSREAEFFYAHPQNRFWRVMAALYGEIVPVDIVEKKKLLLSHGIALWDVIASCEITGSSDNTIKNVVSNDLSPLLSGSKIDRVFANGATAAKLYSQYMYSQTNIDLVCLPSTSPANAVWSLDKLCEAWAVILCDKDK